MDPESEAAILGEAIRLDAGRTVILTDDPSAADLVVFAETPKDAGEHGDRIQRILASALYRAHGSKVVVHSGKDEPRPRIPGLYPSIHARTAAWLGCEGAPYLTAPNPFLDGGHGWDGRMRQLATFRGSCRRKRTRLQMLAMASGTRWTRSGIEVVDTGERFLATLRSGDHAGHRELKRTAVESMLASHFTLCPEGVGLSSFRIFEAMQLGRVPVIIADGWARPAGPDWDTFSLFLSPRRLQELPDLLQHHEDRAASMGLAARCAWERCFAPSSLGAWVTTRALRVLHRWNAARVRHGVRARLHEAIPRRMRIFRRSLAIRLRDMA